ncbi:MAG TPA: substrate-binding domain-containing protein [Acidimicrobiales bacterium]|nr:substrate-binding domain-containing protein [Acidimicrobiales bacterium]
MRVSTTTRRRSSLAVIAAGCLAATVAVARPAPASPHAGGAASAGRSVAADPAPIRGRGSSYVGPAMDQWKADAQIQGLKVSYTVTGSPDGLTAFKASTVDFAGTEAEFSSLLAGTGEQDVPRGFQYIPDVAGAVAVMYNVDDRAGNNVKTLRLSRRTIARIFMGKISKWSDPAISADNGGIKLPDQNIEVVYRSGQSGTTALFYDFVQNMDSGTFRQWVADNRFPTNVRLIALDSSPGFAPHTRGATTSDVMASTVASTKWTISYDEFSYALIHGANVAYVDNQSGSWVRPFAGNISAALESARLRPDLSQELSGVYTSRNPNAYPISAYSYLVTQCARAGDRATCHGNYGNGGVSETLRRWLRYIACEGQVEMANIGYSPLPPNLSQEIANSIARMNGGAPERLSAANCANPRFRGGGLQLSPPAPPVGNAGSGGTTGGTAGPGGGGAGNGPGTSATAGNGAATTAATAAGAGDEVAAGREGASEAVGGGSSDWRDTDPVAYDRPGMKPLGLPPLVVLLAVLAIPPLVVGAVRWLRRPRFR